MVNTGLFFWLLLIGIVVYQFMIYDIYDKKSLDIPLENAVTQGSVLGPICFTYSFTIFTLPLFLL